ncbi:helix-turn-helix domain-containing protein [Streptomyces sp. NPDC057539]|uniref:helix-turn-helix domain-containing protein n=1 Tax=Streptomyces sp. NPDC057539 TaxID=3346159 RepID=UPI0036D14A23
MGRGLHPGGLRPLPRSRQTLRPGRLLPDHDTSPAAWIRHRRPERCRLDLTNPRQNAHPLQAIAERWGFANPTHFSRLLRATYGIPPAGLQKSAAQGLHESATTLRAPTRPSARLPSTIGDEHRNSPQPAERNRTCVHASGSPLSSWVPACWPAVPLPPHRRHLHPSTRARRWPSHRSPTRGSTSAPIAPTGRATTTGRTPSTPSGNAAP